jgi:hypothetical protein
VKAYVPGLKGADSEVHYKMEARRRASAEVTFSHSIRAFHADYSGPNSFERASEQAASAVETIHTGLRIDSHTETVADFESAGGSGLSGVHGLTGLPNIEAVHNLDAKPYLARPWYREVIPLSGCARSAVATH